VHVRTAAQQLHACHMQPMWHSCTNRLQQMHKHRPLTLVALGKACVRPYPGTHNNFCRHNPNVICQSNIPTATHNNRYPATWHVQGAVESFIYLQPLCVPGTMHRHAHRRLLQHQMCLACGHNAAVPGQEGMQVADCTKPHNVPDATAPVNTQHAHKPCQRNTICGVRSAALHCSVSHTPAALCAALETILQHKINRNPAALHATSSSQPYVSPVGRGVDGIDAMA
jgi:hypothetical protein